MYQKDPKGWNDTRDEPLPCPTPGERGCAQSPGARRAHAQLLVPQHLAQQVRPPSKAQTEQCPCKRILSLKELSFSKLGAFLLLLNKRRMFKEIEVSYNILLLSRGPFAGIKNRDKKIAIQPNPCNDHSIVYNVNNDLPGKGKIPPYQAEPSTICIPFIWTNKTLQPSGFMAFMCARNENICIFAGDIGVYLLPDLLVAVEKCL